MPTIAPRSRKKIEYGDFQTPPALARDVCRTLARMEISPNSILEPTCGRGAILEAAAEQFADAKQLVGLDVNPDYARWAERQMQRFKSHQSIVVESEDFFETDWPRRLACLPDPLLIVGNPPWVTNSVLGGLASKNVPEKRNSHGLRGIEALTGKSNFDISEWMLLRMVEWMHGRDATLAMLCKTAVARKVLQRGWSNGETWADTQIFGIDAVEHFDASVDACLLVIRSQQPNGPRSTEASVFPSLSATNPEKQIGHRDGLLVADVSVFDQARKLLGRSQLSWRSGVKHDCSKVLELNREGTAFRNGFAELVTLEPDYVFPMLKSSHIASGTTEANRWMLVTQRTIGEDTREIASKAPLTWDYLAAHAEFLNRRASSIYRDRPLFSVFGVGEYTFALWKVAISGLYKKLHFQAIGPVAGKPVVLDDTCYFLACDSEVAARQLTEMLNSEIAQRFFETFVFWDAKRPITTELLQRLDLIKLAAALQMDWRPTNVAANSPPSVEGQLNLFN
jgi:hypothetical protein